jgi:hypothetical protein
MDTTHALCLLPLAAVLLAAADPSWQHKPISQWDAEDAKQLLADSPWVKHPTPHWLPDLSPFQREDGGNLNEGVGKGVGLAGTGLLGHRREIAAIKNARTKPPLDPVMVRWESALPVRIAERKAGETGAPVLTPYDYAIAVYDIPVSKPAARAVILKSAAFLRRDQKKDIKPSRVEILRHDDGTATILYFFPGSIEITRNDRTVEFAAQIGRQWVSQFFDTAEMRIQGEPQLSMPND